MFHCHNAARAPRAPSCTRACTGILGLRNDSFIHPFSTFHSPLFSFPHLFPVWLLLVSSNDYDLGWSWGLCLLRVLPNKPFTKVSSGAASVTMAHIAENVAQGTG